MKRIGNLFEKVVDFENLENACRRAARGKRRQANVARFLLNRESELINLKNELIQGTYEPGRGRSFLIKDPKERIITAAPFRDRVLQHALMNVVEPIFERRMLSMSFACRKGKGTHRALDYAQAQLRKFDWFLKLDIAQCFASIDHEVAYESIARPIKDPRILDIFRKILESGGSDGRGLAMGSLTSQWTANLVLDRLDHFVKELLKIPGYCRYMDDFILLARDRESLRKALIEVRWFLVEKLKLRLKDRATNLAPARQGLPFLGWRLYRNLRRLRRENLRQSSSRLRARAWELKTRKISEESFAASARSIFKHFENGAPLSLRRKLAALV